MMQGLMSCTGNVSVKRRMYLAEFLKKILALFPGHASSVRRFGVNKTLLVDNISVISLVSKRLIHDCMNAKNSSSTHTRNHSFPTSSHTIILSKISIALAWPNKENYF